MAVSLPELKIELQTDPAGMGYAIYISAGNMAQTARQINSPTTPPATIDSTTVTREVMNDVLAMTDWDVLSATNQELWMSYTRDDIDMAQTPEMKAQILGLLPDPCQTRTDLLSIAFVQPVSRAEELWGIGTRVTHEECSAALALS